MKDEGGAHGDAPSGGDRAATLGRQHDPGSWRRYAFICAAIIILCVVLKLPTLFFQRLEYDEQIYWELTGNWLETGTYSLRGTSILGELPPPVYDQPLFHHPPLFAVLLVPFVLSDSIQAAVVVSWLGHVLAVVGVAIICWRWRRRSWQATDFMLWLPVLAVALDPIMTFCSRKLWLDNLVGGLAGLAMGLFCLVGRQWGERPCPPWRPRRATPAAGVARGGRVFWAAAGGTVLGLAALTKLPALTLIPAAGLLVWWATADDRGLRRRCLVAAALPVLVLLTPWFAVFYSHYASLLPDWIKPDTTMIETSGLVKRAVSRTWHYYLTETALVTPLVAVVLAGYILRRRRLLSPRFGIPLVWVGAAAVTLAALGLGGQGQQLRFLTPALPGLYAMLAAILTRCSSRRSPLPLLALLTVLYGAIGMGFYLLNDRPDEIMPVPEMLWRSL